MQQLLVEVNKW